MICSTLVLEMYEKDGFKILPAELEDRTTWKHHSALPWDVVESIATDPNWDSNESIIGDMHSSSIDIWKKYKLGEKVQMLFRDKMISDDGDITTTRDYNTYVRQMDDIAELKFRETSPFINQDVLGILGAQ